jgi:multiple sugar transport system permease protein
MSDAVALRRTFRDRWRSRFNEKVGYLFILPSLLLLVVFLLVPLLFSLYLSFTDWNSPAIKSVPFIGLANYSFMMGDLRFWNALKNTLYYTVLYVPLGMLVSLVLALILNGAIKGTNVFRALFFMPVISSWVAVSVIWITLLDPTAGVLNYLLQVLGLPGVNWLSDPNTAMIAIVIIAVWKGAGFSMVIWLAGLKAIPRTLYEAALIDGASRWRQFRSVTLPLLAPTTFFLTITGIIGSFQVFSPVYVITKGGPLNATDVVVFRIYQRAFQEFKMGYASALSWLLFAIIFVLTVVQFTTNRRRGGDAALF